MSHWANYIKERLGHDSIETESGFVSFKITGVVCEIFDIYIVPEERRGRKAWALVDEVVETAKQQKCTLLVGYIWPAFRGADESMKAHFAYGFRMSSVENGKITMMKDIGEA
jgi:hypothetical protein